MRIPVAFICDDNYVMQTSVAITSMLKNKNPATQYTVYVVMAECSAESEKILQSMGDVRIVRADLDAYRDIRQMAHISIACLLKFSLCELIPQEDKLLYLDGDLIVRDDLQELYATELGDNYAAAVPLGLDYGKFNAGVMLFNGTKMRQDGMAEKLMAKRRQVGDDNSMDQRVFNSMIAGKVTRFPARFNCVTFRVHESVQDASLQALNEQNHTNYRSVKELLQDAAIIHFSAATKPWQYSFVEFADEWYRYYLLSPYGGVPLKREGKLHFIMNKAKKIGVRQYLAAKLKENTKVRENWDRDIP